MWSPESSVVVRYLRLFEESMPQCEDFKIIPENFQPQVKLQYILIFAVASFDMKVCKMGS